MEEHELLEISQDGAAELLTAFIRETLKSSNELLAERKKHRKKKRKVPGGPRTDAGAMKHLHPEKFATQARAAMTGAEGDVAVAARKMGVSKRTMYHYLQTTPTLRNVKTAAEMTPGEN